MKLYGSKLLLNEQDVRNAIEHFLRMKIFISNDIEMVVDAVPAIVTFGPVETAVTNPTDIEGGK